MCVCVCVQGMNVFIHCVCLFVCVHNVVVCVCVCVYRVWMFLYIGCACLCVYMVCVCVCVCVWESKAWAKRKILRQDSNWGIHLTRFGRWSHVSIAPFALQCAPATAVQSSSVSRVSTATSCTACTAARTTTAPACAIPPSSSSTADHRCSWSPTPLKGWSECAYGMQDQTHERFKRIKSSNT